jgi:hypothetical protein
MRIQNIRQQILDMLVLNLALYEYKIYDDFVKCRTDDDYRRGVIEVSYTNPVKHPIVFQGEGCYKMEYNFGIRCMVKRKTKDLAVSQCLDMVAQCKQALWSADLNLTLQDIIKKSLRFGDETVRLMEENEVEAETDIAEGLMRFSVKAYELPSGLS